MDGISIAGGRSSRIRYRHRDQSLELSYVGPTRTRPGPSDVGTVLVDVRVGMSLACGRVGMSLAYDSDGTAIAYTYDLRKPSRICYRPSDFCPY